MKGQDTSGSIVKKNKQDQSHPLSKDAYKTATEAGMEGVLLVSRFYSGYTSEALRSALAFTLRAYSVGVIRVSFLNVLEK